ncbi:MAG: hypothetical protein R3Y47_08345 [Lachnospiraceae bacterium]
MKLGKFLLGATAVGAAIGGAAIYLKEKGYVTFNFDQPCCCGDDCDCDSENASREYIHVDTQAMKEKATDLAKDAKDKAETMYGDAKKVAEKAADNLATKVEKTWYEAPEKVAEFKTSVSHAAKDSADKVEDFFNDED